MAQPALARAAHDPHVSMVVTGGRPPGRLTEHFAALDVIGMLTPEVVAGIEQAVA